MTHDWQLVTLVQQGRKDSFDELMARYKRPVMSFIYRMTGDAGGTEDLAQDVFFKAYLAICKPGFKCKSGEFSTWLFQIARNTAIDSLRRKSHRRAESLESLPDKGTGLVSSEPSADRAAISSETGRAVALAVAGLPEAQRELVILSEYNGLSYSQIADIVKTTVKSVETKLYRARQTLRSRLASYLK